MYIVDCCVQETSSQLKEAVRKVEEMSTDVQFIGQQLHKLNAFMEVACHSTHYAVICIVCCAPLPF